MLENLLDRVDSLLIGGAMAGNFLAARGVDVGLSLLERQMLGQTAAVAAAAEAKGVDILVTEDAVVATGPGNADRASRVDVGAIPNNQMMLDIGPRTVARFTERITGAGSVIWNGPMGMSEVPTFAAGTNALAQAIAGSDAYSIVGGGDSVAAVMALGLADRFDHVFDQGAERRWKCSKARSCREWRSWADRPAAGQARRRWPPRSGRRSAPCWPRPGAT